MAEILSGRRRPKASEEGLNWDIFKEHREEEVCI